MYNWRWSCWDSEWGCYCVVTSGTSLPASSILVMAEVNYGIGEAMAQTCTLKGKMYGNKFKGNVDGFLQVHVCIQPTSEELLKTAVACWKSTVSNWVPRSGAPSHRASSKGPKGVPWAFHDTSPTLRLKNKVNPSSGVLGNLTLLRSSIGRWSGTEHTTDHTYWGRHEKYVHV